MAKPPRKPNRKPKLLGTYVEPEVFDRFKAMADKNDRTVSAELRRLVRQAMEARAKA